MSSGTETSFTLPSKVLPTHTPSYTLLTSVETNIGESSTSLYQLESTTIALTQTHHDTQHHTTLASTSVAASSCHYCQSELNTLTQTESVGLLASMQASRSSPLFILTTTLTQTKSVELFYSSSASTIDDVGRSSPLLILPATLIHTVSTTHAPVHISIKLQCCRMEARTSQSVNNYRHICGSLSIC